MDQTFVHLERLNFESIIDNGIDILEGKSLIHLIIIGRERLFKSFYVPV